MAANRCMHAFPDANLGKKIPGAPREAPLLAIQCSALAYYQPRNGRRRAVPYDGGRREDSRFIPLPCS